MFLDVKINNVMVPVSKFLSKFERARELLTPLKICFCEPKLIFINMTILITNGHVCVKARSLMITIFICTTY